ncbi:MAG: radical SAM/SPASM domain-containing protein [Thermodesulfobacteriota bacterium]
MNTLQLSTLLLRNALRFQYLRLTGKPAKPQAVSLEITHDCVARCIMCNIWKIPSDVPNLAMPQWLELLSSELFADLRELDITGGEPFLRGDIVDLFYGICDLKPKNFSGLKSIAVTTNGLLPDRVVPAVEKILPVLQKQNIDLVVVCALDAVSDLHDRIRNFPKAWSKVSQTIDALCRVREKFSNLIVGLKTTILPLNIDELGGIAAYAEERGLFTIISPCIITEGRYLNPDRAEDLLFSKQDIQKMIDFFTSDKFQWSFHAESLVDFLKTGTMKKPCSCGFNYFFVRSNGEILLCPLIKESAGNITTRNVSDLFLSDSANKIRKTIGSLSQCRECTEPGLERYSLPFQGLHYLKMLWNMGGVEFKQLHRHMGLDKYLNS